MGAGRPNRKQGRRAREERRRRAAEERLHEPAPVETDAVRVPVTAPPADAPKPRVRLRSRLAELYGLKNARALGRTPWLLAAGTAVSYIGPGSILPLLVIYFTETVGVAWAFVGVALAVQEGTRAIASPYFGGLSDRIGRKPLMITGLAMQAATFIAYYFVSGPATLVAAAMLHGLGQAPYHPSVNALVADVTPKARRAGAFGLIHMAKNLGYTLGIALGALVLASTGGFSLLFFTGAVFPLVYATVVLLAVREPSRRPGTRVAHPFASIRTALRSRRFVAFLVLAVPVFVAWGQLVSVLPMFVRQGLHYDTTFVSAIMLLNSAIVLAFQVPISARADRWGREQGLAAAGIVNAAAYAIFAVVATAAVQGAGVDVVKIGIFAGVTVFTIAEMLDTPLLFALASDLAPPNVTGGAMGVLGLAAIGGLAAAPVLGDLASSAWGWSVAWLVFAGVVGVGALGFLVLGRALRSAEREAPAPETVLQEA